MVDSMNDQESRKFVEELLIAFPAFDDAARSSEDLGQTHRSWAKAWTDLTLNECREALRRLQIDGGIKYEEYREPGPFVRRIVLEARKRHAQSERDRSIGQDRDRSISRRRDYVGSPMASALAAAQRAKLERKSEKEILAEIDRAFPRADYAGPTYRCSLCVDRGLVLVVRPDVITRVKREELAASAVHDRNTYLVACSCGRGADEANRKPMAKSGNLPRYSPSDFFIYKSDGNDAKRIEDWILEQTMPMEWAG